MFKLTHEPSSPFSAGHEKPDFTSDAEILHRNSDRTLTSQNGTRGTGRGTETERGVGRGTRDGKRLGGRGSCRAKNGSEWRVAIGE
ncbi:hypothetical protein [Fervidibacter sacchari]